MLREGNPTNLSELELEFFRDNKSKYKFNKETNQFDIT